MPDERDAQRRHGFDTTHECSLFDDRSGPAPTLAFAKHTWRATEAFAEGARERALASVPGLSSNIGDSAMTRRQLMRRALQPQPPDVLGGWLADDGGEEAMKMKRRETGVRGHLGQRERGVEVALDRHHGA